VALLDTLGLESSVSRNRALMSGVLAAAKLLEVGEHEERLAVIEEALVRASSRRRVAGEPRGQTGQGAAGPHGARAYPAGARAQAASIEPDPELARLPTLAERREYDECIALIIAVNARLALIIAVNAEPGLTVRALSLILPTIEWALGYLRSTDRKARGSA
jgi:hypothetical protein